MSVHTELEVPRAGKLGQVLIGSALPRQTQRLGCGELLFSEGEPCSGVYVVMSGELELFVALPRIDDDGVRIRVAGPEHVIGLVSAMNHAPYSKTGRALSPAVLQRFGAHEVVEFLHASPDRWLDALSFLCDDADAMQRLLAEAKAQRSGRTPAKR